MKTKTIIIAASVVATAVIGTSLYKAGQTKETASESKASSQNPAITSAGSADDAPPMNPPEVMPDVLAPQKIQPATGKAKAAVGKSSVRHDVLLDPEALQKAEQQYAMMEATVSGGMMKMLPQKDPVKETDALTKKLQLRLGLDGEQSRVFHEALLANTEARKAEDPTKIVQRMMDMDRDYVIHLLAMNMMAGDLTPEQQDYRMALAMAGKDYFAPGKIPKNWEKNEDVLAHLNAVLTEAQKEELSVYLEEQVIRNTESKALRRTNELSGKLGLNEADRSALYDYLYENPKATQEDIAEQLSPELRELLKETADEDPFSF